MPHERIMASDPTPRRTPPLEHSENGCAHQTIVCLDDHLPSNADASAIVHSNAALLAIGQIVNGTAGTGEAFFPALVKTLSKTIGVHCALVAELVGDRARAIAVWNNGGPGKNFEYAIDHTPFANVLGAGTCFYRSGVARQFPNDKLVVEIGAESYLGTVLRSADGEVIGFLAVLHDEPIDESIEPVSLLELIAPRAAAEIKRLRMEQSLRVNQQSTRALLDATGELCCLISPESVVLEANSVFAARFGTLPDELRGKRIWDYIAPEVAERRKAMMERVLASGVAERMEDERDGRWFDTHMLPVFDASRNVEAVAVFARDISAQRDAMQHLQVRETEQTHLAQQLHTLNEVGIELAAADNLDDLYRMTVELGRSKLKIDRLSIWLIQEDVDFLVGTYGTDENGAVRSEHGKRMNLRQSWRLENFSRQRVSVEHDVTLYNHLAEPVGRGWNAFAGLWDGKVEIGVLCADNLFSDLPIREHEIQILGLLGALVGHISVRVKAMEALRHSEQRFRRLIDTMDVSIVVLGRDMRVIASNPATERLIGWTSEQLLGISPYSPEWIVYDEKGDLIPPENRRATQSYKTKEGSMGHVVGVDHRTTGERVWLMSSGSLLMDRDGEIEMLVIAMSDITQIFSLERALHESEDRLRAAIAGANDGLYDVNLLTGDVYYSPRFYELLGFDGHEQELLHHFSAFEQWLHPDDREHALANLEMTLRTGKHFQTTYRLRKRSGEYCWFESRSAVSYGEDGKPCRIAGFLIDISVRKRYEDELHARESALRASERRFHELFDHAPMGIGVVNADLTISLVNEAFARMVGYEENELIGKPFVDITYPEDANVDANLIKQLFNGEIPKYTVEKRYVRKDGSLMWAAITVTLLRDDDGNPVCAMGMAEDIDARKKAQQVLHESLNQLQRLTKHLHSVREEERARIAREVHDELGQALTGLKMEISAVKRKVSQTSDSLNPLEIVSRLDAMRNDVDGTISTVRRIATELRPAVLDTLGLVSALDWQARDFEQRTSIMCSFKSNVDELHIDHETATASFRIAQEALTNVARHAFATLVKVRLNLSDGTLRMTVQDDGHGFSTESPPGARSLGLVGMKERAQLAGGRLEIASSPASGTTITLWVPVAETAVSQAFALEQSQQTGKRRSKSRSGGP